MYVFALFLALLISVLLLGLSAVSASQRHALRAGNQGDVALRAARAGIEHALAIATRDPNWRTTYPNGTWLSDVPLGDARYTVRVIDEGDASLSDDPEEDVLILSTGTFADATRTARVRARPVAIDALSTAMTVSTRMTCAGPRSGPAAACTQTAIFMLIKIHYSTATCWRSSRSFWAARSSPTPRASSRESFSRRHRTRLASPTHERAST